MMRLLLWIAALGFTVSAWACYTGTPPCRPGTVDWPRCEDVTQPKFPARTDGGRGD